MTIPDISPTLKLVAWIPGRAETITEPKWVRRDGQWVRVLMRRTRRLDGWDEIEVQEAGNGR